MNKKTALLFLLLTFLLTPGSLILLKNLSHSSHLTSFSPQINPRNTISEETQTSFKNNQPRIQDSHTILSIPESDMFANTPDSLRPLRFSLPEINSSFYKQSSPEILTKGLSETNTLTNLFAIKVEPKKLFNSPLGGKILLDEKNEISGLEINFTLKKNL